MVFQRADGRWICKVKDALRPGKWKQYSFKTKGEAEEYEDGINGDSQNSSRLTVYEAVMLYIKNKKLSRKARDAYVWLVSGTAEPTALTRQPVGYAESIAEKFCDALTRRDLEAVRDACRAGGCGNTSINKWVGRLEAAFRYAANEDLLPQGNPWERFRDLPETHGRRDGTAEDFQKVYAVLPPWMQWTCRLISGLFLRPGMSELYELRWSAWDWEHGCVDVWMGKVGRMKRVYPPAWLLEEALERFRADGCDTSLLCVRTPSGASGRWASVHEMRKARQRAGVKKFPLYAIRHLTASRALEEGADPAAVAAQLGHSSPAITLAYYAHAMPHAQRAAAAKLPPLPAPAGASAQGSPSRGASGGALCAARNGAEKEAES